MRELLRTGEIYECDWTAKLDKHKDKKPRPSLTIDTSAPSTTSEEKTPDVGRRTRKRGRSNASTPLPALNGLRVGSTPGSATVRTSSGSFNYNGTKEDLEAKWAELSDAHDEELKKLQRQEEDGEGDAS